MLTVEDEEFQDTSRVIRRNKSKDIQYNVQMKKGKRTNTGLQTTTQKIEKYELHKKSRLDTCSSEGLGILLY